MRNPGIQFEVIEGNRKGLFGIAYNKEQRPEFANLNKVHAHFFSDLLCQWKPVGFAKTGLISADLIKQIGYVD